MASTIFYAWQSDLPGNTNRNFIERAIKDAIVTGRFKTGQRGARSPGFKTGQCPDASYTSCSSLISNNV